MSEDLIMTLARDTLKTTALLSAPILGASLIVGLIVSVIQAVTQINEQTLTFIPKLIVIGIVILIAGPWMMDVLSHYTIGLFENMATFVRE